MRIRRALSSDARGIANVHVNSWKTTYKNIIPDNFLNNLSTEKREQLWKRSIPKGNVFVAENDNGKIVGFSDGGRERSGKYKGFNGELYSIYILKEYQNRGIGKLLFKQIIKYLTELKIDSLIVLVLEDNNFCYFYEKLGGERIDNIEVEIAAKKLNEIVYGWRNIKPLLDKL